MFSSVVLGCVFRASSRIVKSTTGAMCEAPPLITSLARPRMVKFLLLHRAVICATALATATATPDVQVECHVTWRNGAPDDPSNGGGVPGVLMIDVKPVVTRARHR